MRNLVVAIEFLELNPVYKCRIDAKLTIGLTK